MTDNADRNNRGRTKARLKSVAIIVVMLIIGMVLGGLLTARIVQNRFDRIEALRTQHGFTRFMERSIEFESPEQREEVRRILDRTADRMFEHLRSSRREAMQIMDSARADLSQILSERQMEQLERHLRRRRHRMDRPGPPHDGPPRRRRRR